MAIVCVLLLAAWPQAAVAAPAVPAERISVTGAGAQGDGISGWPSVSADGRYVAFESEATNLVPGDVNGTTDVFVHDRVLGTTVRPVTSLASGFPQDGLYGAAISAEGRYLSFTSWAPDLVPGDTNNTSDVFFMDLRTGAIERINLTSSGAEATGGISWGSDISADGRFVTFTSRAGNLLPGRDKNHSRGADAFVRDRLTGTTTLVSVAVDGLNGHWPSYDRGISADGRYVAFTSSATDLLPDGAQVIGLYVRDLQTGTTTRETLTSAGAAAGIAGLHTATMSRDGRYVTFETAFNDVVSGDTNDARDIFVRDRITGEVELISIAGDGTQADGDSWAPRAGDGGRCVVFVSDATTLVPADTNGRSDLFVRDRQAGTTTRLTVDHATGGDADGDSDGDGRNGGTNPVALRPDGSETAFPSDAANLVPADTNAATDVFVRDTGCR
jgi:Tol biopolymer transport system component